LRYISSNVSLSETSSTDDIDWSWLEVEHPYIFPMRVAGTWIYRVRGLGEINDPNDFGQLLVCEIPLLFIFWRPKKTARNLAFVILPACALVYGIYLTHSRGALLALGVVVLVAARRRIGTVPAVIFAGALFAGAMALHFTGGRGISASAGEDRTALWGESLQLLKSHPVFGIGFGHLPDYLGLTAHNSVVVCVTELGVFGMFFWSLFLLQTLRNTLLLASPERVEEAPDTNTEAETEPAPEAYSILPKAWNGTTLDKAEINHWSYCLLLSLVGFLAAGWFLSRAFAMTFFLLGGIAEVLYETAQSRAMTAPRLPLGRTLVNSFGLMVGLVTAVYIMLRILNLMH
jgi:O-antigen ligase